MGKYRKQVLSSARKLIIEKGVFEFSMRDLAKECDLSVGTLYREVRNKDDLLLFLFIEDVHQVEQALAALERRSDVTPAEKIICAMGFAAYSSEFFDNPMGTNFLGSNLGLVRRASAEALSEVRAFIVRIHEAFHRYFRMGCESHLVEVEERKMEQAFTDLVVIVRGLHLIKNSFIYKPTYSTVDKLCRLSAMVLAGLEWKAGAGEIDPRRVSVALKTLLDQHVEMKLPKKS